MDTTLPHAGAAIVGLSYAPSKEAPRVLTRDMFFERGGITGDRHRGHPTRQVCLLDWSTIEQRAREAGVKPMPGQCRENIAAIRLNALPLRLCDRLALEYAELEVTSLGRAFGHARADACSMQEDGVFARVVRGGAARLGGRIRHLPRTLRLRVITMSDRARQGVYEDRSGPRVISLMQAWADRAAWRLDATREVLPDDAEVLTGALESARGTADLVLTTGGTGPGPRDITPEAVGAIVDRQLPGIMEHIRVKFGGQKPLALLSRGIAGLLGETPIFTLPGSPRAVDEYLGEITPLLEHLLLVARGIDPH